MNRGDYVELLEHSYQMEREINECPPHSRVEYLAERIFEFTTYDGEMAVLFGERALEVCKAINSRTTFDYIEDRENYVWFLTMCNMPFFSERISWGTSIRGAFWSYGYHESGFTLKSCGLWKGGEQVLEQNFTQDEWPEFIEAMIEFAAEAV